jgi:hypothetical protein
LAQRSKTSSPGKILIPSTMLSTFISIAQQQWGCHL